MSERIDSSHALCRERMARRLAVHLWAELTAGRLISTPEAIAAGIDHFANEYERTGNRGCLRFFRAVERQAGEHHRASPDTWRLAAADLRELDREARAARTRREQSAREVFGLVTPTGGAR